MLRSLAPLVLALAVVKAASLVRWNDGGASSYNTDADCWSFSADITAQASNIDLQSVIGPAPTSQEMLVQANIDEFAAGSTVMAQIASAPPLNISGTYSLHFEYCQPKSGTPKGVFQTHHGIVGNAAYWNVQVDGSSANSFADAAAGAGWATLSYDRLGVGQSDHPDGIQVVQINYEIAQSVAIASLLRSGQLGNGVPTFSTVVGVGHSYGSLLLAGVASVCPDAFDINILTGFAANTTSAVSSLGIPGFETTIANVAYPDRWSYGGDYVSTPSVSIDQKEFFHYPNYTEAALQLFTTTKGEYTLGQIQSLSIPYTLNRDGYSKPTMVITGENDAPFCASNCLSTSLGDNATQIDTSRPLFPSVSDDDFEIYMIPATGHGINFHTTAADAYQYIIDFVSSHL